MRATKIYVKSLFNLGNYSNEEVGIEIELQEGDSAKEAVEKAKKFVEAFNPKNEKSSNYKHAKEVLLNKDGWKYRDVIEAEKVVEDYERAPRDDDYLPF